MKNVFKAAGLILAISLLTITTASCVPDWNAPKFWFPFGFPFGLFGLALYLLPTIIAVVRRAKSTLAIILVNILTGWTFIGWIIALVWSLTGSAEKR